MKPITLKEFAELAKNDEALKVKIKSIVLTGEEMPQELIDLAAEYGYELTEEGISSMLEDEELPDEELEKIAGGTPKVVNKVWFCRHIFSFFGWDPDQCSD